MSSDPARSRFMVMQVMRWSGVALAAFGGLILAGRIAGPRELGSVLFFAGLIDALLVPMMLARRWRTPPPS